MRRILDVVVASLLFLAAASPALAATPGYADAERDFQTRYTLIDRLRLQVLLIAGGYTTGVPTEHFSARTLSAIQGFEAENGFVPNGHLDGAQADRLMAVGMAKLDAWGFQKVMHPNTAITLWVPLGLGLIVHQTASGLHYKDPQGRLQLDFVSVPRASVVGVYRSLLTAKVREGATIHYEVSKDDWFVISATTVDGADHYYRYHQDGSNVTGFALEWNNAHGNINGERIAVIVSGSLWSAMTGAPFIDPPEPQAEAKAAPPVAQPATVPVAPVPPSKPKDGFSSGSGFFVTDAGHFVTNAHVVAGCSTIAVKSDDGSIADARLVASDATNDLALLKLDKTPARIASLRIGVRLGEGVEAFGFPHSDILSTSGNFTLGNVTATSGMKDDSRYLQISAPVNAGNSGGPLLDTSGNLVGVVSAKLDAIKVMLASDDLPQNVNFAVKAAMVAAFLDASRVTYKVGMPGATMLQPADLADQARAMSGFVVCR